MKKYILFGIAVAVLIVFVLVKTVFASQTPYKVICHHTPGNQVTLTFQNQQSYFGHLGTPHNNQTYDTNGACTQPTATPTPTVAPTVTPTPIIECDEDCEPTPTPSPEPTITPEPTTTPSAEPCTHDCGNPPTFAGSSTNPPVCTNGNTVKVVANPHVWRNGSDATVNFFITEGDSANIYWGVVGKEHWQNAVADIKGNSDGYVSYTIHDLDKNLGYDFGIQQKNGCGGGQTTAVVVDGPEARLFHFSYYE